MITVLPILSLLLVMVTVTSATGQKYAERGYNHASVDVEEYEADSVTDNGDWNDDGPEIFTWHVKEFPHPQLEPVSCRRTEPGNVCNPNEILTLPEARSLDIIIREIYNETSCICERCDPLKEGVQIGIAILKYTFKPYGEMPSKVIQSFAKNLRSKWRLGDCDDDILIVLVTEDRMSYTDVGRATSTYISHEEAQRIFLENRAFFSQRKYFEGLRDMLEAYREAAKTIPRKLREKPEFAAGEIAGIIIGSVILIALVALALIWFYLVYKQNKNTENDGGGSGHTLSSTWRRKMHLSPAALIAPKDDYKPCKTEDEHQRSAEETMITEIAIPEDEFKEEQEQQTETKVTVLEEADVRQQIQTNEQPDDNTAQNTQGEGVTVLTTFLPHKRLGLHQTDL